MKTHIAFQIIAAMRGVCGHSGCAQRLVLRQPAAALSSQPAGVGVLTACLPSHAVAMAETHRRNESWGLRRQQAGSGKRQRAAEVQGCAARISSLIVSLSLCLIVFNHATAQSTISTVDKFAYGANTGWLNWRPSTSDGVVVGEAFLSGKVYAANFGWIDLGDGTPVNGHTYANTSATDCGVNHDGAGNLSGFAYGANIGWINFGWAGANDPNRPFIDLGSGQCFGYAYSANTGWINIGTGDLYTDTMTAPDLDADGIADAWEFQEFGNLSLAGIGTDRDHDGQSDAAEYAADTNPNSAADFLRIVSQTYNGGMTQVTLQIATTRPTRLYRIETSTTLLSTGPGAWATDNTIGYFTTDPGGTTAKIVTFTGAPRRFFRVAAERPLP